MKPRFLIAGIVALLSIGLASPATAQTLMSITVAPVYDHDISINLGVAAQRQYTATGNYSDGSQQYLTQQVTWRSANGTIAKVTAKMGLVTAVAPGTVNINATMSGITGTASIIVIARQLNAIAITPATSISMQAGKQRQFSATAEYGDATIQNVTTTAGWSTLAPAVATVSSAGMVTAVGAGVTTITAGFGGRIGSMTLTVTATTPPNLGTWSPLESLGMIAIHAAVLHTGKVLFWGYPLGRTGGPSPARLYDPIAKTITDVTVPWPIDIFCSGSSFLPDGRLLVDGGMDDGQYPKDAGIPNTTFFDPSTNLWSQGPVMAYARWYPSTLAMPDGTILAASGTDHNAVVVPELESYNPATNTWKVLPASANIPTPIDTYPLLIALANGNVFYSAPRQKSIELNLTTNTWSSAGTMIFGTRFHAASVLLPGGQQVMAVGGAGNNTNGGGNATTTTETIDFSTSTPAWSYSAPLNIARYNHNLLYLADGSLLAVGGNQSEHYDLPVFQPELYNFTTGTWTLLPAQNAVRGYHSTAVLLPDGRVISAGSDSGTSLGTTYEFYSPPYLFNGPRPTITTAPASVAYGQQFTIVTPNAAGISKVALIRPAATTHAAHMDDHRYVTLKFTAGSGQITATAPASANLAPPGYYMLVVVNAKGVPSIMPFVQLQ